MGLDKEPDQTMIPFDCPHCGQGFELPARDALFTDHVRDECTETCSECGKEYRLQCVSVDIEMRCLKAV